VSAVIGVHPDPLLVSLSKVSFSSTHTMFAPPKIGKGGFHCIPTAKTHDLLTSVRVANRCTSGSDVNDAAAGPLGRAARAWIVTRLLTVLLLYSSQETGAEQLPGT
jgi:hypothetical protein